MYSILCILDKPPLPPQLVYISIVYEEQRDVQAMALSF